MSRLASLFTRTLATDFLILPVVPAVHAVIETPDVALGVKGDWAERGLVRAFGLRRSRYRGSARTHLQHVATAAAIDLQRLAAWFRAIPRAATRTSRFAA